jgi:CRP/FNR family transcriptional regulator, cyclic AMP receptor protein
MRETTTAEPAMPRKPAPKRTRRGAAAPAPARPPRPSSSDAHAAFPASLLRYGTRVGYRPKRVVFHQGDPAEAVHFIESGHVRLTVLSQAGKAGVIAILGPGEFFGEGCLAGQPLHLSTASTMTAAAIVTVGRARMMRMMAERPELAQLFIGHLLARNIRFEADLIDQLFNSSEKRLARVLLLLARFGKQGRMETVIPPISQDVLAAKVGTTRSRINFFMNKFRRLGFIEYDGELRVHSALLNVIVHD